MGVFSWSGLWAVLGMGFMVWAFGTYQAFIPFYIALTLIAFILWYLRDDTYPSPEAEASKEGVRIGTGIFAKLTEPERQLQQQPGLLPPPGPLHPQPLLLQAVHPRRRKPQKAAGQHRR